MKQAIMHRYKVFGLLIASEFEIPFLLSMSDVKAQADVSITKGHVPDAIEGTCCVHGFHCSMDHVLFSVPQVGKFWVRNKKEIVVEPNATAVPAQINTFILGSSMGALLHQRGYIVLHANAVSNSKRTLLFAGEQGMGKSTIAAAFCKQGYNTLTDDLAVIQLDAASNQARALPGYGIMKLKEDALNFVAKPHESHMELVENHGAYNKQVVRSKRQDISQAFVDRIYVLDASLAPQERRELSGYQKLTELRRQVFRPFFVGTVQKEDVFFRALSQLAQQVSVVKIGRPQGLQALMNAVENEEF